MEKKKERKVKSSMKKLNVKTTEQSELKSFIIVVLVVLACVLGLYFITTAFVAEDKAEPEDKEVAGTVNYDVAIMGQLLNRPYDEYLVLLYSSEESEAAYYSTLLSKYEGELSTQYSMLVKNPIKK